MWKKVNKTNKYINKISKAWLKGTLNLMFL